MIRECAIDPARISVISECMATYGMEERDPDNEWAWNIISRKAVVYSCGTICRDGEICDHNHNPSEIELCQRISKEVADLMSGEIIDMGDEGEHGFSQFYVVANNGGKVTASITEEIIRSAFGSTIYPDAEICIEPLEKDPEFYSILIKELREQRFDHILIRFLMIVDLCSLLGLLSLDIIIRCHSNHISYLFRRVKTWLKLVSWFRCQSELHGCVFASVNLDSFTDMQQKGMNFYNGGCVLPRLFIGSTQSGSLAGVFRGCLESIKRRLPQGGQTVPLHN